MKLLASVFLLILPAIFLSVGCKKDEVLITGNEAPVDPTVSNVLRENYVQKAYLNLVGRQPSDSELIAGLSILNKNNCSVKNRQELLEILFNSTDYLLQLYFIENSDMLGGLSDISLEQSVIYYQEQLDNPVNAPDYLVILDKLEKTQLLASLKTNMLNKSVNLIGAHYIISNSPDYESLVGSGTEWTEAIFNSFLLRNPTEKEIENCNEMFDNMSSTLFLKEGHSKDDLLNILFNSDEYFEGQVRTLYQRYLFREPEADVATGLAQHYKESHNYVCLQKEIMLTNEFLGIKK